MKLKYILVSLLFVTSLLSKGIVGQKAPSFEVDKWIQIDSIEPEISAYRGKVLFIYGFQSWCPGCHSHGFPTLNELSNYYKKDKGVSFVAIQTVFEGYSSNSIKAAKKIIKDYKLTIPVGHSGLNGLRSKFMVNYNTGGTPWTIIVDKKGIVRFSNFHLTTKEAIAFIEKLKSE